MLPQSEDQFSVVARQMGKWIEHVLGPGYQQYCPAETWAPPINLYESTSHYFVVVDLAGVRSEEIDLRVDNKVLVLSGRREVPMPAEATGQVQLHLMEIDHGHFYRRMQLPGEVDVAAMPPASYGGGYLWIRLPRKGCMHGT